MTDDHARRRRPQHRPGEPLVIGLCGGIGAGKSAVAAELQRLGCVVTDSDRVGREVLTRRHVLDQLVAWWGPHVLNDTGQVDRARVAQIVFADPEQRQRLEALTHPLIKADRHRALQHARDTAAPALVIDAPLLFEAGLDAECHVVLFVDAPREQRLARVRTNRGWDEAELARRESAQLPLDAKRQRADHVVINDADTGALREAVRRLWPSLLLPAGPETASAE